LSIAGILFDMDGVLIDSEPFWRKAEIEIFARVGLHLSEEDCHQTTGLRIDEVVDFRFRQKPWQEPDCAEVARQIVERVIELVSHHGSPLPGAREALEAARQTSLPVGLASSSCHRLIRATLERLQFQEYFQVVQSAEEEEWGKPHPAVYLQAARNLGVEPARCLAIEDSFNGVLAARAARMRVIAIPEPHHRNDPRFVIADRLLDGLPDFPQALRNLLQQS